MKLENIPFTDSASLKPETTQWVKGDNLAFQ